MKKSFYTVGSLVILLIAAFVFVLVPVLAGRNPGANIPAFGKYEGTEIRYGDSDFDNYLSNYAEYYKQQGYDYSKSYYSLFRYAFNATVIDLAATKEVQKSGYTVPQSEVNRALMPYFLDENGKFNSKAYKQADPVAVADMQKEFRKTLTKQRFTEDMFGGVTPFGKETLYGLKVSSKEFDFYDTMNKNNRGFNMATFDMTKYPNSEKVAYGKNNSEKFVKYDFSVITCADKSKADSVAKRIANNEITFADAITEYSQKIYSTDSGKLTSTYQYQIARIIKDADNVKKLTDLTVDAVSEPVETTVGYSIFRLNAEPTKPNFNNEDTVKVVYNYLMAYETSHIENYYTETAKAFATVAKKNGFNAACKQFGVEKITVPAFPLNYGNLTVLNKIETSLNGLSGIASNENFFEKAFSLKMNELSEPIVNNRSVLVLQLTSKDTATENRENAVLNQEIKNYDIISEQSSILDSKNLKDNFDEVYYKYFDANNQ
ncbi:MAG: peptidylprolyl isomerase [Treponema sp.]|jgi:hypothetical protein|nr:peptidylprolyl isomerase [Treponema sp.]